MSTVKKIKRNNKNKLYISRKKFKKNKNISKKNKRNSKNINSKKNVRINNKSISGGSNNPTPNWFVLKKTKKINEIITITIKSCNDFLDKINSETNDKKFIYFITLDFTSCDNANNLSDTGIYLLVENFQTKKNDSKI